MKKRAVSGILLAAGTAVVVLCCIKLKKEYDEMKKMENELESHPLYRAKKEAARFAQKKDMKTVSIPENSSLKSRLSACLEILK